MLFECVIYCDSYYDADLRKWASSRENMNLRVPVWRCLLCRPLNLWDLVETRLRSSLSSLCPAGVSLCRETWGSISGLKEWWRDNISDGMFSKRPQRLAISHRNPKTSSFLTTRSAQTPQKADDLWPQRGHMELFWNMSLRLKGWAFIVKSCWDFCPLHTSFPLINLLNKVL